MPYFKQDKPFVVPTNDGKLIEEHFGMTTNENALSIAHMIAPPGWGEPFQTPEFDEYTLVSSGTKKIEADGDEIILSAGQSILIKKRNPGTVQQSIQRTLRILECMFARLYHQYCSQGRLTIL